MLFLCGLLLQLSSVALASNNPIDLTTDVRSLSFVVSVLDSISSPYQSIGNCSTIPNQPSPATTQQINIPISNFLINVPMYAANGLGYCFSANITYVLVNNTAAQFTLVTHLSGVGPESVTVDFTNVPSTQVYKGNVQLTVTVQAVNRCASGSTPCGDGCCGPVTYCNQTQKMCCATTTLCGQCS